MQEQPPDTFAWGMCFAPFILYMLALLSSAYFRRQRRTAMYTTVSMASNEGSTTATSLVYPLKAWQTTLNEQPDTYPHILLLGSTGSGKTTLCKAMMSYRKGLAVALIAKREDANGYPCPCISYDRDGGMTALLNLIEQLASALRTRESSAEPLTIIIEDYPMLCSESELRKPLTDLVLRVARVGRSLRMRLVLLAQERTGKATGFEGQVAALDNFLTVRCHRHNYTTELDGVAYSLPSKDIFKASKRAWTAMPFAVGTGTDGGIPSGTSTGTGTGTTDANEQFVGTAANPRDAAIEALIALGLSANKIHEAVGGTRAEVLARVKELKKE